MGFLAVRATWEARKETLPGRGFPVLAGAVQLLPRETAVLVILFCLSSSVFTVSTRPTAALLLASPLYAAWCLASFAKIKYMHTAVQPLDLVPIPEFLPLFRSFFGIGLRGIRV
jgi:hypothetical protein